MVYAEHRFLFWLTWKEINFWKLSIGEEITKEKYVQIVKETVLPRAKNKAILYLQRMDRTEHEVRKKLERECFLPDIIEEVINYLREYTYIDNVRYIENFIYTKRKSYSTKWIEMRLLQKGIKREDIQLYMDKDFEEDEAIQKAIYKKVRGKTVLSREEYNKIYAYLYRKGFKANSIRKAMDMHCSSLISG